MQPNGFAILLPGQHADPKREPQGECFGPIRYEVNKSPRDTVHTPGFRFD